VDENARRSIEARLRHGHPGPWPGYGQGRAARLPHNVEKLRTRVTGLIHEGKSQADLAKFMETEYKWAPGSLNQQWSVPA